MHVQIRLSRASSLTEIAGAITKRAAARRCERVVIVDCPGPPAGVALALSNALTDQLSSYRRTFDERLIALETGLADPEGSPALESLVLEMVRAVADEAEA